MLHNFLNPPLLFFVVGIVSVWLKVNITIPESISRFLTLYLLLSIGFHGGTELACSPIYIGTLVPLLLALIISLITPIYAFFLLKKKFSIYDTAAIAATYGSASAVVFVAAAGMLQAANIPFGGYMIAALSLMEAPAIIVSLGLARRAMRAPNSQLALHYHWYEGFFEPSVFMLLSSLVVGLLSGYEGACALKLFTQDLFKGFLSVFMLDMGIVAAQRITDIKQDRSAMVWFAVMLPTLNGFLGLCASWLCGLSVGDAFLLTALSASASYIAVPAAMRLALPQASPSYYLSMALGITFPFTILVLLPLFFRIVTLVTH